jgi:hypothetical protein
MPDIRLLRSLVTPPLIPFLGKYTIKGADYPAIVVVRPNGEVEPPIGTKVVGLETVIFYPELKPKALLNAYKVREDWILHLKQWEQGKGINEAIEALLEADLENFVIDEINQVPADYKMGIPLGAQIKIHSFAIIGD